MRRNSRDMSSGTRKVDKPCLSVYVKDIWEDKLRIQHIRPLCSFGGVRSRLDPRRVENDKDLLGRHRLLMLFLADEGSYDTKNLLIVSFIRQ